MRSAQLGGVRASGALKWLAPRQGEVGPDFCEVGGGDYKEIAGSRCALAWCMRFFAGLDGLIYAVFRG